MYGLISCLVLGALMCHTDSVRIDEADLEDRKTGGIIVACQKPEDYDKISMDHKTKGVTLAQWIRDEPIIFFTDAEFSSNSTHVKMELTEFDNTLRGLIECQTTFRYDKMQEELISIGDNTQSVDLIRPLVKKDDRIKCCIEKGVDPGCSQDLCRISPEPQILSQEKVCPNITIKALNSCMNQEKVGSSVSCCQAFGMPNNYCLDLCSNPKIPVNEFTDARYQECLRYSQIVFSCKSIFKDEPDISIKTYAINKGSNHLIYWQFPYSRFTQSYSILINDQLLTISSTLKPWFVIESLGEALLNVQISADTVYGSTAIVDPRSMRNNIILEPVDKNKTYAKVTSTFNMTSCCQQRGIPQVCQPHLCAGTFPSNIHSNWLINGLCMSYLTEALNCHYTESDVYSCCQKNNVHFPCNRFCSYMADTTISSEDVDCLIENMSSISQCLVSFEPEVRSIEQEVKVNKTQEEIIINENLSYSKTLLISGELYRNGEPVEWSESMNDFSSAEFQDLQKNLCRPLLFKDFHEIAFISCSLVRIEPSPVKVILHQIAAIPSIFEGKIILKDVLDNIYKNKTDFSIKTADVLENTEGIGSPPHTSEITSYHWVNETTVSFNLTPAIGELSRLIYVNFELYSVHDKTNEFHVQNLERGQEYLVGIQNVNKFGVSDLRFITIQDNESNYPRAQIGATYALSVIFVLLILLVIFTILSIYFTKTGFPIAMQPGGEKIMMGYARIFKIKPKYCEKIGHNNKRLKQSFTPLDYESNQFL